VLHESIPSIGKLIATSAAIILAIFISQLFSFLIFTSSAQLLSLRLSILNFISRDALEYIMAL
jgi:hypothetical protein